MIEVKQLEYFVVCADCKSFSQAAEILYTTQPNVSRIIRQLEEQLGIELFVRQARGIALSDSGKQIYQYAVNILNNARLLSSVLNRREERQLAIASLPSNLIANLLSQWYNDRRQDEIFCAYWEGHMEDVVRYVESHQAEVGFVSVHTRQLPAFQHLLAQKKLLFHKLICTNLALVVGRQNAKVSPKNTLDEDSLAHLGLISYQGDNFALDSEYAKRYRVLTNSEHMLITLLRNTDLASITTGLGLHTPDSVANYLEIPFGEQENCVYYGYIKRKQNELSAEAADFIDLLSEHILKQKS